MRNLNLHIFRCAFFLGSSTSTSCLKMMLILFTCAILAASGVQAISSSWRPIVPVHTSLNILHQEASILGNAPTQTLYDADSSHLLVSHNEERCSLYKIAMTQQLYFEVLYLAEYQFLISGIGGCVYSYNCDECIFLINKIKNTKYWPINSKSPNSQDKRRLRIN